MDREQTMALEYMDFNPEIESGQKHRDNLPGVNSGRPAGQMDFLYNPPTAKQLERRQKIRSRIAELEIRPLRDSGLLTHNEYKRLRTGIASGIIFTGVMLVLAMGSYLILRGGG